MQRENATIAAPGCTPQELLEHLFGDLEGYFFTLTGKQSSIKANDLTEIEQHPWKWPANAGDATAYLLEESTRGRDSYFSVHLFQTRFGRTVENAAPHILTLWVDGDGAAVPDDWPQPSAVISSSPGREHFYWRLAHPIVAEQATQLNKRLCYGMNGDKGKWGLGTILRPPGTRNYKRETPSEVTGVIHV
jgi:hypothetical protein